MSPDINPIVADYVMEYFRPNKEIIRSINKRYRKPKNTCFCGAKIKTSDVRFADYFDILGDWNLYVNGNS
jgi:hypothetical protein